MSHMGIMIARRLRATAECPGLTALCEQARVSRNEFSVAGGASPQGREETMAKLPDVRDDIFTVQQKITLYDPTQGGFQRLGFSYAHAFRIPGF